jgi:glycosyltransferase involved in cell wall biosynthesis
VEDIFDFPFSGNERIITQQLFYSIKNTFTYELWVKPEEVHKIDNESQNGISGIREQRYIIGPGHGGEQNQAGTGISIGENGVSVYEHTVNHLPATLVYPSPISDWIHVAVVYQDKTPYLFINGTFAKKGLRSMKENIYASGIFGGLDPYGSFIGNLKYIRIWDHARTEDEINENMYKELTGNEHGLFGIWDFQRYQESRSDGILFISHTMGGGTEHYLNNLIEKTKDRSRLFKFRHINDSFYIENLNAESPLSYNISFKSCDPQFLRYYSKLLGIKLIYINHLITLPIFNIMNMVQYSDIDYIYFIHDYHCACPRINLLNIYGVYCNNETNIEICQNCVNKSDLLAWRERFYSFLLGAKSILAPSKSAKDIIKKYYPNITIDIQEHSLPDTIHYTFDPVFTEEKILNIAFIGRFQYHKGLNILSEVQNAIQSENLPIHIKVFGTTIKHPRYFASEDGKYLVTGVFKNSEISNMLAANKISIVVVPSICPETFSYVTGEAMLSGYPVITFNIGAPADRVRKYDGGWVADFTNSSSILEILKRVLDNRHEILEKANNLRTLFYH